MNKLLKNITCDITFRPENGTFRSRLAEIAIANADEESAELFSERNCDIQVKLSEHTVEEDVIRFLVVSDLGEQLMACDFSELSFEERSDFDEQLVRQLALHADSPTQGSSKVIIRKDVNGMLDIHQAAQRLGCSQKALKSNIPCTDYSYIEVDGKKEIQEYFWSQNLISRLCDIKANGAKPEDLHFVAEECCHGDEKWAEELVSSLTGSAPASKPKEASAPDAGKQPTKNKPKWFSHNRNKNKNS